MLLACMHHGARERAGNRRKGGRGFARWPFYWICGCRIASRQSRQSRQDNDDQEETERARASRARISKGKDGLVALGTCMPGFFFFFFTGIKTMTMMMYLRPPFMPVASHVITFSPCFTLPCSDSLFVQYRQNSVFHFLPFSSHSLYPFDKPPLPVWGWRGVFGSFPCDRRSSCREVN